MKLAIPATVQRSPVTALLLLIFFTISGCSGGGNDTDPRKNEISGVVLAPAVTSAALTGTSLFARTLAFFFPASIADIVGLSPLPNVQVELVRLDSQGNVSSVLLTTTANALGEYTFTTSLQPDSTLAVRIQNPELTYNYALVNTTANTDITPVSDAVYDTIAQEIGGSGGSVILENFTVDESAALVGLVDGLNIDVSSALTLDDAVTLVTTAAGTTLPDMTTSFAAASQSATLNDKSFYITGTDTTLHDPFALGGAGNGGIGIAFDRGYAAFASTPTINGNSFYDPVFHNLSVVASTQDQYINRTSTKYVINGKNQLVVVNPNNSTTVGFSLADGTLLAYPLASKSAVAGEMYGHGLEISVGNEWGDATLATIEAAWSNTIDINYGKKDANILNGSYNLVQLDNQLASLESQTAANQAAMQIRYGTVSFTPDPGRTFGTLASGTLTTSQVSLDIDSYVVSNTSGSDGYNGRYKIGGSGYLTIDDPRTGYTFLQGNMAFNRPIAFLTAGKDIYAAEIDDILDNAGDAADDTLNVNSIDTTGTTGTVVLNNDDSISYTPLASATGTDSFSYTVSDGSQTSTPATVTINLNSGNAAPVATADNVSINTGATNVELDVLDNDSDAVGDTLTIDTIDTTGTTGSVAVNADNKTINYTPAGAGAGADSFTYTVSDGASVSSPATVSITVAANTAPTATADNVAVNTGAVNVTLDVLANDSDAVGDTMSITNVSTPTYGSVVNNGNTISYTPDGLNSSPDSFTYTAFDGVNTSTPATVTITVAPNAAPTANPISYSIDNDNEGRRSLAVMVRQGVSMANADVSGTYSVVEYSNGFDSSGTVSSGTRQGTLVFNGLGAITGGTLHQRRTTMDVPTAKAAASSSLTDQPSGSTPDSPTVGSLYTVNTDGTIDVTLILGTDTISGHGAVTADGQLISLVLETNTIDVSGSRGMMLLSRQP